MRIETTEQAKELIKKAFPFAEIYSYVEMKGKQVTNNYSSLFRIEKTSKNLYSLNINDRYYNVVSLTTFEYDGKEHTEVIQKIDNAYKEMYATKPENGNISESILREKIQEYIQKLNTYADKAKLATQLCADRQEFTEAWKSLNRMRIYRDEVEALSEILLNTTNN